MAEIYFCDAEKFAPFYEKMLLLLPKERTEKAERLFKQEDKILSAAAGLMVTKIFGNDAFDYINFGEHGKPFFEHGKFFSISHSIRYSVLAVSDNEIGVDIEMKSSPKNSVAERCFTEEEQQYAKMSTENFFRIWTAKEALLKLLGTGFSYSPKGFSVLPFESEHEINGINMRFFFSDINGTLLTAAYCGDFEQFTIREFLPEDFIK